MLALKIIVGVLLVLFLLTLIPVQADLQFQEEFALTLRYFFLRFHILPGKEKEDEKPEPEPEPEEKKKGGNGLAKLKNILKAKGFFGFLQAIFELIGMVAVAGKNILSCFRINRFDLYLCVGGKEDAAQGAILYGQLSAAVYSACSVLFTWKNCRKKAVTVDLDYNSENTVNFSARISILPLFVLKEGISLLIKGLPKVLELLRAAGGPKHQKRKDFAKAKTGERQ